MEHCFFIFGTVTRALSAKRILGAAGIPVRLGKRTGHAGCAYGLELHPEHATRAARLLQEGGLAYEWERRT